MTRGNSNIEEVFEAVSFYHALPLTGFLWSNSFAVLKRITFQVPQLHQGIETLFKQINKKSSILSKTDFIIS